jgi:hypothetical protein
MNISVVVNGQGEIAGAVIQSAGRATIGPTSVDEFKLPTGHKIHEVSMPPELAIALLDGKFAETFRHYKLVEEKGKPALKRA